MKKLFRVLMLEDSEADFELIAATLQESGLGVTTLRVDSRDAFTAALREFEPDVVLSDHALASFNSRSALEILRTVLPAVPLIVVTGAVDERLAVACLRSGAEDVLLKSHLDRLPTAIATALDARKRLARLSPRQLQVLRFIAEGHSTPDIARRLRLSAKTVETHRTELMKRLDIHDLATLVRYAVRVGIVSAES